MMSSDLVHEELSFNDPSLFSIVLTDRCPPNQ